MRKLHWLVSPRNRKRHGGPCPALPAAKPSRHTVLLQSQQGEQQASLRRMAGRPAGPASSVALAGQEADRRPQRLAMRSAISLWTDQSKAKSRAGQQEPSTTPASFSFIPDRERKPNCVSKNSCFPKKKNSCFEPPGEEHSQDRDTQLCWPSESQYSVQGIISFLLTCLFA